MSKQIPFFMSGPRLVLRMDGFVMAFAVGLDITVSRNIQTIYQFGQVSPVANQATLYNGVTGSMQIIKMIDPSVIADKKAIALNTQGVGPNLVNSIDSPTVIDGTAAAPAATFSTANKVDNNSAFAKSQTLRDQLDPERVLLSSTFDIEVWQTYPDSTGNGFTPVKHFTIQNCRLNSRGSTISPGSLTNESIGFVGTLLVTEQRQQVSGVENLRDLEDSVTVQG